MANGVDWCTGKTVPYGGPRVMRHPQNNEEVLDFEVLFLLLNCVKHVIPPFLLVELRVKSFLNGFRDHIYFELLQFCSN